MDIGMDERMNYGEYDIKKTKKPKKLCTYCGKHAATYFSKRSKKRNSKKRVRTGKHHTLCIRCYGAELDRVRGEREKAKEVLANTKDERDEAKKKCARNRRRWRKRREMSRITRRRDKEEQKVLVSGE